MTDDRERYQRGAFAETVRRAFGAYKRRQAIEALARWAAICLPGAAALFLVALILPPERIWSGLLALVGAVWVVGTLVRYLFYPLLRPGSGKSYLIWLEGRSGLGRNELINALDLEQDSSRWEGDEISRELIGRAVKRGEETLSALPLAKFHKKMAIAPKVSFGLLGLLPFVVVWLWSQVAFRDAADLFLKAGHESVVPNITLTVLPGDLKAERGASVQIQAFAEGRRRPGSVNIDIRRPDGAWVASEMIRTESDGADRDGYEFIASVLKGDLEYRVGAGWATSPIYKIRVLEKLQALGYRKLYKSPAYTGVPPLQEVSINGNLSALQGSEVTLFIRHRRDSSTGDLIFSNPVSSATGQQVGTYRLPLTAETDGLLQASWLMERPGSYRIELRDEAEGDVWVSDSFQVETVPDLVPAVRLLSPPPEIDLPSDMFVTLVIDCIDDFGLGELALIYGRANDDPTRVELASWENEREARITYNWNLDDVTLMPGQELHYYLQVTDNDIIHGPKIGETDLFTIRFPSMAEMFSKSNEEKVETMVTVSEAMETQDQLQKDLAKIAQEMLKDEDVSWERQQEVKDLLDRQSELGEKVESMQQALQTSQERIENQNLFSGDMAQKVQEIQSLVQEIQSEEFRQIIEKMNQAMESMNGKELQKAMEEMKITQEEISQSLDRTLQMLHRLLEEEKLDQILQQVAEMENLQEEINKQLEMGLEMEQKNQQGEKSDECKKGDEKSDDSEQADQQSDQSDADKDQSDEAEAGDKETGEKAPADSLGGDCNKPMSPEEAAEMAARQEELRKALEKLKEQLAELQKECEKSGNEEMAKALEEQMQKSDSEQTLKDMKQALEAMQKNQRQPSLKFGRKAKTGLEEMKSAMMQCKQEIDIEKLEAIARACYNVANRMVRSSHLQEDIAESGNRLAPGQLAVVEQELYDEIGDVSDSLMAVARETTVITREHLRALREIMDKIASARNQLESGRRQQGLIKVRESVLSLNSIVKGLLEAANNAQSSCSSSSCASPFNRMQKMSGQQSSMNQMTMQQMQSMQMPRQGMSSGQSMLRMAARQEMIKQGLSEIRDELEGQGGTKEELGQIIEEMEQVVDDLKNRRAARPLIERQEQILNRLLTAQRSMRRRDESKRRRSHVGINPGDRLAPEAVGPGESLEEILQRAMLRGAKDPVPVEYRRMVERYMQTLLQGTP